MLISYSGGQECPPYMGLRQNLTSGAEAALFLNPYRRPEGLRRPRACDGVADSSPLLPRGAEARFHFWF